MERGIARVRPKSTQSTSVQSPMPVELEPNEKPWPAPPGSGGTHPRQRLQMHIASERDPSKDFEVRAKLYDLPSRIAYPRRMTDTDVEAGCQGGCDAVRRRGGEVGGVSKEHRTGFAARPIFSSEAFVAKFMGIFGRRTISGHCNLA